MNTSSVAMKRTRMIVIAALAAAGLAGVAVHAASSTDTPAPTASGHRWHGHGPARHFMHVLKQLNLTPEQQTQVKSIFAAAEPQFKALGTNARSNAEAMAGMSPTDSGYPALLAAAKANAAARIQQMSDVKTQIFAVLTKTQQEKIPQIIAADKAKWQQRRQDQAPQASTSTPASSS